MPVKIIECVKREPDIIAVEIPDPCTIRDADEIEKIFNDQIQRSDWRSSDDLVSSFRILGEPGSPSGKPGFFIVKIYDYETRTADYKFMYKSDFKHRYNPKEADG